MGDMTDDILGAKGGKKGGGGAENAANTLRSNSVARIVDLISEGPIEGLVNGEKSIYFDQTPIRNEDDTLNFEGVVWEDRKGLPDDEHLDGHDGVEALSAVDVEVGELTPVVRTITDSDFTAVRMIIRVNSLFRVDQENGTLQPKTLRYAIDVKPYGGAFEQVHLEELINQKTVSAYQIAHRLQLPLNGAPWDIRVRRLTSDDPNDKHSSTFAWESYVGLIEGRFTYPHSAVIGIKVDAKQLGSSIPQITYHVRGLRIKVPSNYDPVLKTYAGIWDGTFKIAWTNNPAWIFYDLVTNDRYGIGEFVTAQMVNKWSLYTIGQYCDEQVPSGLKNDAAEDIMEPRFAFNGVIQKRREAFHALQTLTTAFRGMGFWSLGSVFAVSDRPADPVKLVTEANVVGGEFSYSSTATKARSTVALVRFNDPADHFKPTMEMVVHEKGMRRYGWRERRMDLEGCTSRGMAHRYGKWVLDTEQNATETVQYKSGFDHLDVVPGDIVAISDKRKAQIRLGGRIVAHDMVGETITMDGVIEPFGLTNMNISLTDKDGHITTFPITPGETTDTVNIGTSATEFLPGSVFILSASEIEPVQYRILTIQETDENIFQITGLIHDPTKYARVEQNIALDSPIYTIEIPNKAPQTLQATEQAYLENERARSKVQLSWQPPRGVIVREYVISMDTPNTNDHFITNTGGLTAEANDLEPGDYVFKVRTIDRNGVISAPVSISYTVQGTTELGQGVVADLTLSEQPGSIVFRGRDASIQWNNVYPKYTSVPGDDLSSPLHSHNMVSIYAADTSTLLRTQRVNGESYVYTYQENSRDAVAAGLSSSARSLRFEVSAVSVTGHVSAAITLAVSNPVPESVMPVVTASGRAITVAVAGGTDNDLSQVTYWIERDSGFDTGARTPVHSSAALSTIWQGDPDTTYYVKIGYRDIFDSTIVYSPEVAVTTDVFEGETDPGYPETLVLSTELASEGTSKIIAIWNANPETWVTTYEIQISQGSGPSFRQVVASNRFEFIVPRNVSISVSVAAIGSTGRKSIHSPVQTITSAIDTVAPATPTGLVLTPAFKGFWMVWDKNSEPDFSHYEVGEFPISTGLPDSTFITTSTSFVRSGLDAGVKLFYALRAVDTSGNASAWSAKRTNTTLSVDTTVTREDLAGLVDATSMASGISLPSIVDTLPTTDNFEGRTVVLTTDGALYRYHATAWTRAVQAIDVNGKLTASQIGAAAIGVEQLAADSVTANAVAIGDFTNYTSGSHGTWANHPWNIQPDYVSVVPEISFDGAPGNVMRIANVPDSSLRGDAHLAANIAVQESDEFYIEFWAKVSSDFGGAGGNTKIRISGGAFVQSFAFHTIPLNTWTKVSGNFLIPAGLTDLTVRVVSDFTAGSALLDGIVIRRMSKGELLVDGSIRANHVGANEIITEAANIGNAVITSAKIFDLDAAKIRADTALLGSVTVGGTPLGTVRDQAADPAAVVNNATTQIDPGKIVISGDTSLAEWRGLDETTINGGTIETGSITVESLMADILRADNIIAGQMSVDRVVVDGILNINAASGGLSIGKTGPYDSTEGIYMGRTLNFDSSIGFSFSVSMVSDLGIEQSLLATAQDGLRIKNASFIRDLGIVEPTVSYLASQVIDLSPGVRNISVSMIGAGGGGSGGGPDKITGNSGEPTTVRVLDGAVVMQEWIADGGVGGSNTYRNSDATSGQNSPWGTGGAGGRAGYRVYTSGTGGENGTPGYWTYIAGTNGGNATGRGAGGGGGGDASYTQKNSGSGGEAGKFITISDFDVSGLVDPKLEIIIGNGGAGSIVGDADGGAGALGRVDLIQSTVKPFTADVITLEATAFGVMTNKGPFPDLGAGLWILHTLGSTTNIALDDVEVDDSGQNLFLRYGSVVSFVSKKTPIVSNTQSSRTINYKFHKMGP